MHLMLTNKGPTPMPIGSPDAGGYEDLLPPGLEIAFARDDIETLIFGEQPEPAGRSKLDALAVDPASPLAVEYGTNIDQWKGRSDVTAEEAEMLFYLFVRNVGRDDVTITTTNGDVTIKGGDGVLIETLSGSKLVGAPGTGPDPDEPGHMEATGFTAEQDPQVTVDDATGLNNGNTVALVATGGTPEAQAAINGKSGAIYDLLLNTFRFPNVDLTGVDVTGLTATATFTPDQDNTGTISAFTAANPSTVTMDAEDEAMLSVGSLIMLEALAGDPTAMAYINGQTMPVLSKAPVMLDLDLSGADVTGLTADFVVK
jgi:hypothetical protein